jgi:hypothetical protein
VTGHSLIPSASSNELEAAVADVYERFLDARPDVVELTPARYGAKVRVEGGRSRLESALLAAGRADLFREEREALAPPMLDALQARVERLLNVPIEALRIESDLDSSRDTFLLVLSDPA